MYTTLIVLSFITAVSSAVVVAVYLSQKNKVFAICPETGLDVWAEQSIYGSLSCGWKILRSDGKEFRIGTGTNGSSWGDYGNYWETKESAIAQFNRVMEKKHSVTYHQITGAKTTFAPYSKSVSELNANKVEVPSAIAGKTFTIDVSNMRKVEAEQLIDNLRKGLNEKDKPNQDVSRTDGYGNIKRMSKNYAMCPATTNMISLIVLETNHCLVRRNDGQYLQENNTWSIQRWKFSSEWDALNRLHDKLKNNDCERTKLCHDINTGLDIVLYRFSSCWSIYRGSEGRERGWLNSDGTWSVNPNGFGSKENALAAFALLNKQGV